jgi:hypothetical protein
MRKLSALTPIVLFSVILARPAPAQVSAGAFGGVGLTRLGGDITLDYRIGILAGGNLQYQFSELWAVELDAFFAQKGGDDELAAARLDGTTVLVDRSIHVNYVEFALPVILRPEVDYERFKPRLYGAPRVAIEMSCKVEFAGFEDLPSSSDCEERVEAIDGLAYTITKSVEFGLIGGVGADIGAGRGVITVDLRYDHGITNINDAPTIININGNAFQATLHQTNRSFLLIVGYRYKL